MRELTGDTRIRIRKPRPALTGDTRIRLSQIVDLLTWRLAQDKKDRNGAEHSDKNGRFVKQNGGGKKKTAAQRKFEQTHKQTKNGTRSAKNNTPMRKPKIAVNKDIPVTKSGKAGDKPVGTLLKGQEITNRTSIARGEGIDCVDRLKKTYGKDNTDLWSKDEGNGIVLQDGDAVEMPLHFYSYDEEEIYEPKNSLAEETEVGNESYNSC